MYLENFRATGLLLEQIVSDAPYSPSQLFSPKVVSNRLRDPKTLLAGKPKFVRFRILKASKRNQTRATSESAAAEKFLVRPISVTPNLAPSRCFVPNHQETDKNLGMSCLSC